MTHAERSRTAIALIPVVLLVALSAWTHGEDKPAGVPTTHYVDMSKHFEMDVPLSWERKWSEDGSIQYIFMSNGKSADGAQPPEFDLVITGPDPANPVLKSDKELAASVKRNIGDKLKFDNDSAKKVDGAEAVAFTGTGKTAKGAAKVAYLVTVHNGIGYTASFACDPATFDAEIKGAQAVFDSIKWGKQ